MVLRDLNFTDLHVPWPPHGVIGPSVAGLVSSLPWQPVSEMFVGDADRDARLSWLSADIDRLMQRVLEANKRGRDSVTYDGIRYRISTIPEGAGVTYILGRGLSEVPKLKDLNLPARINQAVEQAGDSSGAGLVLIVGPMRSAKTTLAGVFIRHWLETRGGVGYILDDPPELALSGRWGKAGLCYQRAVVGENWGDPLRDMLRSRARFQMLGEIRSDAAAKAALRMAIEGATVVSTIHGHNVEQGIMSLCHYAIPSLASGAESLAAGLRAVIRPRLEDMGLGRRIVIQEALVIDGSTAEGVRAKLARRQFSDLRGDLVPEAELTIIGRRGM